MSGATTVITNDTDQHDVPQHDSMNGSFVIRGESENQDEVKRLSLNTFYLWGLGISIVVGGQFVGWNEVLKCGFGGALIATALITSAYYCLICCMAEISSAIPFGGGSYGVARVTLGFFPGYMVGVMEVTQNVVFVAQAAVSFGNIVTVFTGLSSRYEIYYGIFFYVTSLALQIAGGRTFWYMIMAMAVVSVCLLLIYIFGTIPALDFDKYALFDEEEGGGQWFRGGVMEFLRALPFACWFYVGVESINLACKDVPNPRVQVPRGYLSCMTTLAVLTFGVLFCCPAVAPGIEQLMTEVNPLHIYFQVLFRTTNKAANAIILPTIYSMCFGFMYCYGKQLKAMSKSGLVNPFFAARYRNFHAPVNSLIAGSLCAFIIGNVELYMEELTLEHLFVVCMMCAFTAYASQFASFVVFRYKFPTIHREYYSPLGVAGAVYGCAVFTLAFIASVAFQEDYVAVSLYVCVVLLAVAYYFAVSQKRQVFSEEEKQVMFCAYLMKSNADRNVRLKKGNKSQIGFVSSPKYPKKSSHGPDRKYEDLSTSNVASAVANESETHSVVSFSVRPKSNASSSASSHRLKLWVFTGSDRIAITGEINADDLLSVASLRDALVDNEDVVMLDCESEESDRVNAVDQGPTEVRETIVMSQSVLLSSADHVHCAKQHDVENTCGTVDGDLLV